MRMAASLARGLAGRALAFGVAGLVAGGAAGAIDVARVGIGRAVVGPGALALLGRVLGGLRVFHEVLGEFGTGAQLVAGRQRPVLRGDRLREDLDFDEVLFHDFSWV